MEHTPRLERYPISLVQQFRLPICQILAFLLDRFQEYWRIEIPRKIKSRKNKGPPDSSKGPENKEYFTLCALSLDLIVSRITSELFEFRKLQCLASRDVF